MADLIRKWEEDEGDDRVKQAYSAARLLHKELGDERSDIDQLSARFSELERVSKARVQPQPTMSTQDAKAGKEELFDLLERCESNRNIELKQKLEALTKQHKSTIKELITASAKLQSASMVSMGSIWPISGILGLEITPQHEQPPFTINQHDPIVFANTITDVQPVSMFIGVQSLLLLTQSPATLQELLWLNVNIPFLVNSYEEAELAQLATIKAMESSELHFLVACCTAATIHQRVPISKTTEAMKLAYRRRKDTQFRYVSLLRLAAAWRKDYQYKDELITSCVQHLGTHATLLDVFRLYSHQLAEYHHLQIGANRVFAVCDRNTDEELIFSCDEGSTDVHCATTGFRFKPYAKGQCWVEWDGGWGGLTFDDRRGLLSEDVLVNHDFSGYLLRRYYLSVWSAMLDSATLRRMEL